MHAPAFLDRMGLRSKLIAIFIAIKVVPLLLLAWLAWTSAQRLGNEIAERAGLMADAMRSTQKTTGETATNDAIKALDERSREAIEALSTRLAQEVADFLYERDQNIRQAATLEPQESAYRRYLQNQQRLLYEHGAHEPTADGKGWQEKNPLHQDNPVRPPLPDNAKSFHARAPEDRGQSGWQPLFLEMTFIGTDGQEKIKVQQGNVLPPGLRDVSKRENTYVKAERYWPALKQLKPGEIYVSEVIGPYVPTHWIGPYTQAKAAELKKPFKPEESGYAGLENPVGKRFRGIIRWAMPVVQGGQITGYVTLALDHRHLMAITDHARPTEERLAPIADPASGNYAFMWDHKSRNISHPRDYFIVGYDPATGQEAVPWLDGTLWKEWKDSGKPWPEFRKDIPPFRDQSLQLKPSPDSSKSGSVGLDCRYLNFSPQCHGWDALTEHGGSGSFTIFFSGLWKLTTAAAIPYYTGQYGKSKRGFGYITIGANVDDFHKAATDSGQRISTLIAKADEQLREERESLFATINSSLATTAAGLLFSTVLMIAVVIVIAIWMAGVLSSRITAMIGGIHRFEAGDLDHRLEVHGRDEMAQLATSFNRMADSVRQSLQTSEEGRRSAEEANRMKSEFLASMSHELRTPLNGILGFAELLEAELTDPAQREYAETIRNSGEHLLRIVNDVLDLAKIEAGRMEYELAQVALPALLQTVVAHHRGHAQTKGLEVGLELPEGLPPVYVDPTRIRQILDNLLNNAVKFTSQGSVTLSAIHLAEANCVEVAIADTGCGIPHDYLDKIFDKFQQVENFLTRQHGGTGLGLALTRQLLEHMGGTISVESTVGHGSVFRLRLPINLLAE